MYLAQPIPTLFYLVSIIIAIVRCSPIDLGEIQEEHNMKKREVGGLGYGNLLRSFDLGSGNLLRCKQKLK